MPRFLTALLLLTCTASAQAGAIATTVTMNLPPAISQGDQSVVAATTVIGTDGSVPSGYMHISFSGYGDFWHYITNGSTNFTLYSLPVGTYQVKAYFLPDQDKYEAGGTATQTLTVVNAGIATNVLLQMPTQVYANLPNDGAFVQVGCVGTVMLGAKVQLSISNFGTFTHTTPTDPEAGFGTGTTIFGLVLPAGTYQVQAICPAQTTAYGSFAESKSDVHTLTVVPATPHIATTTTITLPSSITQGDSSIGARAIVDVKDPSGNEASGSVQLTFSGFGTFTHTLGNGTAYTLYSLPVGTYQVQASYQGRSDNEWLPSTSQVYTLTVVPK